MNEKLHQHRKKAGTVLAACLGLWTGNAAAQSGVAVFGNTYVGPGSELHIKDYALNFQGGLATQKTTPPGLVSFNSTAAYTNASATGFIDGFVRSSRAGGFTFPVGTNGIYAPLTLTAATETAVDVLYNRSAFNTDAFSATDLEAVSGTEYWDVIGNNNGTLSLSWQTASALGDIITTTDTLIIAGWNGTSWIGIPSAISDGATVTAGTITTNAAVDLTVYSAFTFAKKYEAPVAGIPVVAAPQTYMFLSKGEFNLKSDAGVTAVQLFDITGKLVATYTVQAQTYQAAFIQAQGIYIAKAQLTDGRTVTRKLLNY